MIEAVNDISKMSWDQKCVVLSQFIEEVIQTTHGLKSSEVLLVKIKSKLKTWPTCSWLSSIRPFQSSPLLVFPTSSDLLPLLPCIIPTASQDFCVWLVPAQCTFCSITDSWGGICFNDCWHPRSASWSLMMQDCTYNDWWLLYGYQNL